MRLGAARSFGVLVLAAATAGVWLSGCIPKDAGRAEFSRLVNERSGVAVEPKEAAEARAELDALLAQPLTYEAVSRLVLSNNPEIGVAAEEIGVARAKLVHAATIPNPTAEAGLRFHGETPSFEIGFMQDLTELLYRSSRKGAAESELRAAAGTAAQKVIDVLFRARAEYVRLQAHERLFALRKDTLIAAEATFDAASRLREAGNITELELARHQTVFEQAKLLDLDTEAELLELRQRLATSLGIPPSNVAWRVHSGSTKLPERDGNLQDLAELAVKNNLELASLEQRAHASRASRDLHAVRGWVPELKAGVSAEREEAGEWGVGPVVEVEIPLFNQGQGAVDAADATLRVVESNHGATLLRVRHAVNTSLTRLSSARARVERLDGALLPLHRRLVAQALLQYNAMSIGVFELLAARQSELVAQELRIAALRDYWLARNDLAHLRAGGIPRAESTARSVAVHSSGSANVAGH